MKKFISIATIGIVLPLAACGGSQQQTTTITRPKPNPHVKSIETNAYGTFVTTDLKTRAQALALCDSVNGAATIENAQGTDLATCK